MDRTSVPRFVARDIRARGLDAAVEFLAALALSGPALEFGIGTGRLAFPLKRRGISVHGIELSRAMVAELQRQPEASDIGVTIGDFATTKLDACFRNAARHLEPGGYFVIENFVPELRRLPPGENVLVFTATPTHVGVDEYDFVNQIEISRHWWMVDGDLKTFESPHPYAWPSELDLMASMTGMTLRERWADWYQAPFTPESRSHISVWQRSA